MAAAGELAKDREIYTSKGVFSDALVDWYIKYLTDFHDENLREELKKDPEREMRYVLSCMNNG